MLCWDQGAEIEVLHHKEMRHDASLLAQAREMLIFASICRLVAWVA